MEEARHFGSIVLQVDGSFGTQFGLEMEESPIEIAVTPAGNLLPALKAELSVAEIRLPFGLPNITDAQIKLDVASGAAILPVGALTIEGTIATNPITLRTSSTPRRTSLAGSAELSIPFSGEVGPVYVPNTDIRLTDGFVLDTVLEGRFALNLSTSRSTVTVQWASIRWNNGRWSVPDFTLQGAIARPDELAEAILTYIDDHAYEIFEALFDNTTSWSSPVLDGLLTLSDQTVQHVARVLASLTDDIALGARLLVKFSRSLSGLEKTEVNYAKGELFRIEWEKTH